MNRKSLFSCLLCILSLLPLSVVKTLKQFGVFFLGGSLWMEGFFFFFVGWEEV